MTDILTIKQAALNTITQHAQAHIKQSFNQLANAEKIGELIVNNMDKKHGND
jgi:hypothetical protein